jgi:hypothetical protein
VRAVLENVLRSGGHRLSFARRRCALLRRGGDAPPTAQLRQASAAEQNSAGERSGGQGNGRALDLDVAAMREKDSGVARRGRPQSRRR